MTENLREKLKNELKMQRDTLQDFKKNICSKRHNLYFPKNRWENKVMDEHEMAVLNWCQ